jgi:rubrerythrin
MNAFTASEIVAFASRIHENGAHFYKYAIQLVKDEEAKDLFYELADEELKYKQNLDKIFAGMEPYIPQENYTGEYAQYMRDYIDNNIVFTKEAIDADLASVKDACTAIDFAAQRELDSIHYYENIKRLVPESRHEAIDDLIAEEKKHYTQLTSLRNCMLE